MTDPGRANARTALAWQRTALSLLAGSLAMARVAWSTLGATVLVLVGVAAALSVWVFLESHYRYAHDEGTRVRPRSRGGRAPFTLATATILLAVAELTAMLAK